MKVGVPELSKKSYSRKSVLLKRLFFFLHFFKYSPKTHAKKSPQFYNADLRYPEAYQLCHLLTLCVLVKERQHLLQIMVRVQAIPGITIHFGDLQTNYRMLDRLNESLARCEHTFHLSLLFGQGITGPRYG